MKQGNRQRACDRCKGTGQESAVGMVMGDQICPCRALGGLGGEIQGMHVGPCRICGDKGVIPSPKGICYNCYGSGIINY